MPKGKPMDAEPEQVRSQGCGRKRHRLPLEKGTSTAGKYFPAGFSLLRRKKRGVKSKAMSQNMGAKRPEEEHVNDVQLSPMGSDGEKMMQAIEAGNMIAVLSKNEIMYTFLYRKQYQCFIHPIGSEEGRHKGWEINERNRAMLKQLPSAADQLFEIKFKPDMDFMGVMVAAEQGIVRFLDSIGQLPADDVDFMTPYEPAE